MPWNAANNEAFASDVQTWARDVYALYERAKKISAKYTANSVAASPAFVDAVAMEKVDVQAMASLITQIINLVENGPLTQGDYRTNIFKALRTQNL